MSDPKLTMAVVRVTHRCDDGYCSEQVFHDGKPRDVLMSALEELTRLTALHGFAEEAKVRFDKMQASVADFHAQRKGGAV